MADDDVQEDDSQPVETVTFWDTEMIPKEDPNNDTEKLPVPGKLLLFVDVNFGISKHKTAANVADCVPIDTRKT